MIPCGITKFKTVRNVNNTDGWVITGLDSLGPIGSYTDNCGNAFNPASSVCVTITVLDTMCVAVVGARVGLFDTPVSPCDTARLCGTTNACGVFTSSTTVGGDTTVSLRVRLLGFKPSISTQTIDSCTGLTAGVTFITCNVADTV